MLSLIKQHTACTHFQVNPLFSNTRHADNTITNEGNGLLLWCQYRSVKSRHILVIIILLAYYLSVVWKGGLPWVFLTHCVFWSCDSIEKFLIAFSFEDMPVTGSDEFYVRMLGGGRYCLISLLEGFCVFEVLCYVQRKAVSLEKKEARESDVFFSPSHWTCSNDYGYYDINICKHDVTCVLVFIVHRHNWWFCELLCPLFFSCKGYALLFIPCCSYSWWPADVCFVSFEILFEVSTVAVGLWWDENYKKKLNSWSHSWSKRLF